MTVLLAEAFCEAAKNHKIQPKMVAKNDENSGFTAAVFR